MRNRSINVPSIIDKSHIVLATTYDRKSLHEIFQPVASLLAMSLGDMYCLSRKGGTGEVGGCIQRVQTAWLCLGSGLERPCLGTGWHGSFLSYARLGLEIRKQSSHLVGLQFKHWRFFTVCAGGCWLRVLIIETSLILGVVSVTNLHRIAARVLMWS